MTQTSLIVGLGLLVYAVSDFGPIDRFAYLMFTILMLALLADLTVTPALLYSPFGRLFLPIRTKAAPMAARASVTPVLRR